MIYEQPENLSDIARAQKEAELGQDARKRALADAMADTSQKLVGISAKARAAKIAEGGSK